MKLLPYLILAFFLVLAGCDNNKSTEERKPIAANDTKGLEALMKAELKKEGTDDSLYLGFDFTMSLQEMKEHASKLKLNGTEISFEKDNEDGSWASWSCFPSAETGLPPVTLNAYYYDSNMIMFRVYNKSTENISSEEDAQKKQDRAAFVRYFIENIKNAYGNPHYINYETEVSVDNDTLQRTIRGTSYLWFNKTKMIKLVDLPSFSSVTYYTNYDSTLNISWAKEVATTLQDSLKTFIWDIPFPMPLNKVKDLEATLAKHKIDAMCTSYETFGKCEIISKDTFKLYVEKNGNLTLLDFRFANSSISPWNITLLDQLTKEHGKPYLSKISGNDLYVWIYKRSYIQYEFTDTSCYLQARYIN